MRSKKGGFLEVNYLFTGLLFFFIFGIILSLVIGEEQIEEITFTDVLEDLTEEMGAISGAVVATILGIGSLIFSIFGVSLIGGIGVLPIWFSSFISLYAIVVIVFGLAWLIGWLGNVIPFT